MDIFMEKIVQKGRTPTDRLITIAIIIVTAIACLVFLNLSKFLGMFGTILAAGVVYLAYRLIKSRNIEFEYIVTNGEIDIDKIMSKSRRKRIFSANCKDFDVVAKVKSDKYTQEVKNIQNKIMAASSMVAPDLYFFTLNYKGKRTIVYFEPDEKMLTSFRTFIPRNVFI
jgi:hypothetical protein